MLEQRLESAFVEYVVDKLDLHKPCVISKPAQDKHKVHRRAKQANRGPEHKSSHQRPSHIQKPMSLDSQPYLK